MRLTKKIKYAAAAAAVILAEQIFAKYIAVGGAVPMFTFCFIIIASMLEDELSYTLTLSAACGIVCDILAVHGIGTYTFTYTFAAWAVYELHNKLFSSRLLFLEFAVFVLTFLLQLIYFVLHMRDIGTDNFLSLLTSVMLASTVYNMVISLILWPVFKNVFEKRR